ncbi:MAG: hypothetical protein J6V38_04015 [Kiritimatiellae bacterium]|nr:hypothetical protein [Kiritimatiellia bacterium]
MKSNFEIRSEAWNLLMRRGWIWKLLGASILLSVAVQLVVSVFDMVMSRLDSLTVNKLQEQMRVTGEIPVISGDMITDLLPSVLFSMFIGFIMSGITAYGNNLMLNRAVDDNEQKWLPSAFGGFKIPLDLAWLKFRMSLVYLGWSSAAAVASIPLIYLLLNVANVMDAASLQILPLLLSISILLVFISILTVPFYRYRFLFRIKADHPDWTASECMQYCRELTNGNKMRSFKLDCSYWGIITCFVIAVLAFAAALISWVFVSGTPNVLFGILSLAVLGLTVSVLILSILMAFYVGVGQTVLYRELRSSAAEGE